MRFRLTMLLLFAPLLLGAETVRLGDDVVPRAQGISLTADPRMDTFTGSVAVELDVRKPVSSFRFHAQDMTITSLSVNGADARMETGAENIVTVTPSAPLLSGRATMTAEFEGRFNRQAVGLYKMVKDDEPYLFTQFQAIDARRAFPSWDEPGFKLPYQLTVTIPAQYDAVSNTPVAAETASGQWKTVRFAATKPLPSYLIALAVGKFDFVPIEGMSVPGRVITPKGQAHLAKFAAEVTPSILAAAEKYFASKHPFEKVDLIAVPEFWAGAMENPGAITYRDTVLLVDSATVTPRQKRDLVRITAHELAHMWFGDLVTMEWWDDFWLNESFADWMGDKITEQVAPELGHEVAEMEDIQAVMNADVRPSAPPIRPKDADPIGAIRNVGLAYNKGKAVLSMIEQWVGPEKFRQGVLDHLRANAWGNADAADFWAALSRHAPKEVTSALASFIDLPGIPLVTVEPLGGNRVRLSQRRFVPEGSAVSQVWQIPVTIRYGNGSRSRTQTFLLDRATEVVTLDARPSWIFPTANGVGYYRWTMPAAEMTKVAGSAAEVLTPRERVSLVGNASALFRGGVMRGDVYLDVLSRFSNDRDPQVVNALMAPLRQLRSTFDSPGTRDAFAAYVRRLLRPALDRIGMGPREGEPSTVTQLRPALIAWLADRAGDPDVQRFARDQAQKYLAGDKSVDPSIAGTALVIHASDGDERLMEEYRKRFESASNPAERTRFLSGLGGFDRPEVQARVRDFALSGAVRTQELFLVLAVPADATEDERQRMFEWYTANYDRVMARMPRAFTAGATAIAGGCDEKRLEAARRFFSDEKRRTDGTERALKRVEEAVTECVTLRSREMTAIAKGLQIGARHQSVN